MIFVLQVGVNDVGEIQYLTAKMYEDDGHVPNDLTIGGTVHHFPNAYDSSTWTVFGYGITTDNASNTWCRAPGITINQTCFTKLKKLILIH